MTIYNNPEPIIEVPHYKCATCGMTMVTEGRILGDSVWMRYPCDSCKGARYKFRLEQQRPIACEPDKCPTCGK